MPHRRLPAMFIIANQPYVAHMTSVATRPLTTEDQHLSKRQRHADAAAINTTTFEAGNTGEKYSRWRANRTWWRSAESSDLALTFTSRANPVAITGIRTLTFGQTKYEIQLSMLGDTHGNMQRLTNIYQQAMNMAHTHSGIPINDPCVPPDNITITVAVFENDLVNIEQTSGGAYVDGRIDAADAETTPIENISDIATGMLMTGVVRLREFWYSHIDFKQLNLVFSFDKFPNNRDRLVARVYTSLSDDAQTTVADRDEEKRIASDIL
jgi:hypothetical protein